MDTTYNVKIWKIETRVRKTKTNYRVVWFVAGARFSDLFDTFALADSFRSDLVAASRRGEAFDRTQGLPDVETPARQRNAVRSTSRASTST